MTLPTIVNGSCDRASAQEQPLRHITRRVLVVDDSVDAADTTAALLEASGCVVRASYSGERAVVEAKEFQPEIVLLDLGMPDVDGFETCRRIRSLPGGDSVCVVAVTGWGQEEDRRRTREAGFDTHLVKPVDPNALLDLVEQADVGARAPGRTGRSVRSNAPDGHE